MAEFDKHIARDEILYWVLQFCTGTTLRDGHTICHGKAFYSCGYAKNDLPQVGDLLRLTSIRMSQWSLCWLHDIRVGGEEFLCESIETGEMCWWSNVGVSYLDREAVASNPQWRWNDRQHKFNKRWNKVCYRDHDAYITLPLRAVFGEGNSVTLGTRRRYGGFGNDFRPSESFPDWRKVTKQMMGEVYQRCVEAYDVHKKEAARED